MLKLQIFLMTFSFSLFLSAQQVDEYEAVDKKALAIPESLTYSADGLARYINKNFVSDDDKLRAIFVWLSSNINYDVKGAASLRQVQKEVDMNKLLITALKERKGVCLHYSMLFRDIADRVGIRSYTIRGYTKKNGSIMEDSHQWATALVDGKWYLFDPTWGAGHVSDSQFIRKLNNYYYKVSPSDMIKSHMPFDPLWQLLDYPLDYPEFDESYTERSDSTLLDWRTILRSYDTQAELDHLVSMNRRMAANGNYNSLVRGELLLNQSNIEIVSVNNMIAIYNDASTYYNKGVGLLNSFIAYRNRQFNPEKSEVEIRTMLLDSGLAFSKAVELLNRIHSPNEELMNATVDMKMNISSALANLQLHQEFVDKYFSTEEELRGSLFYKPSAS